GMYLGLWFQPMTPPGAKNASASPESALLSDLMGETEWLPTLAHVSYTGEKSYEIQGSIRISGEVNPKPALTTSERKLGSALGAVAGLGTGPKDATTTLTGVWLEYEVTSPERKSPRVFRRAILDLEGPEGRVMTKGTPPPAFPSVTEDEHAERALALGTTSFLRPTTGDLTDEFLAREQLLAAVHNQRTIAELASSVAESKDVDPEEFASRFRTPPTELAQLANSRSRVGRYARRVFIGELNLTATHTRPLLAHPGTQAETPILFARSIDIVMNTVGVRTSDADEAASAFDVRLEQGVLDTVLESKALEGFSTAAEDQRTLPANTSRLARMQPVSGWSVLSADRDAQNPGADPMGARVALHRQSPRDIAVVPPAAAKSGSVERGKSFWSIDPSTGTTLGIGPRGWGEEATTALQLRAMQLQVMGPARYYGIRLTCLAVAVTARVLVAYGAAAAGAALGWPQAVSIVMATLAQTGASGAWFNLLEAVCNAVAFG
ncbi:MAG: hypothetical protein AAGG01_14625, partial [Planctomycetota bacterium]